jgi:hypothetical protein
MDANYIQDAHKELVTIARTANEAVKKMVEQLEKRRSL